MRPCTRYAAVATPFAVLLCAVAVGARSHGGGIDKNGGHYSRKTGADYGVSLPNFAGMEGYTASERAVFVIDKDGVIQFKWVGENPGVEPDYDEVQRQVDKLN